jgi:tetratricopeptide (TPR) repeat protein
MSEEVARLLQEGIAAAKAGDKVTAKRLLIEVTDRDPHNEQAWLWLSGVVDDQDEMQICLENVLSINPENERARKGLAWIETLAAEPPPPPVEEPLSAPPPLPIEEPISTPSTAPIEVPEEILSPPSFEEQFGVPAFPSIEGPFDDPPMPSIEERLGIPAPPSVAEPFGAPPSIEEQITTAPPMPPPIPTEEPSSPENRVPCPACGASNFDFASECVKCSFPFALSCPSCNELVPTETGFCPNCHVELPLPVKLAGVQERDAQIEDAYRLGLAHMENKRLQEAKAAFEQALVQDPDHIEARYNLGVTCGKLGLRSEARDYLEEVQVLQPEHPYVRRELQALLSPRERRQLARERRQTEREKREQQKPMKGRPAGQTLLAEYEEKRRDEGPVAEELTGLFETFLYVLIAGLVIGVTYVLTPNLPDNLGNLNTILDILKQAATIAAVLVVFWIILGIVARLLSRVFRSLGKPNGYMVSAGRFLTPFFLLVLAIVLSVPRIVEFFPQQLKDLLEKYPWGPLYIFGGLAFFWGLLSLTRGISRVGRIALWKGFIVAIFALAIALAVTGGLAYAGYNYATPRGYLTTLGFGPMPTPTPQTELPGEAHSLVGRYRIRYPEGWQSHVDRGAIIIYQNEADLRAEVPISPTVMIEAGPLNRIAGGSTAGATDGVKMVVGVLEDMRKDGTHVEAINRRTFEVSGATAESGDLTISEIPGFDQAVEGRIVCIHLGNQGIVILGMSVAQNWAPFSPIFDDIVRSLKLEGGSEATPAPTVAPTAVPTPIPSPPPTPSPTPGG